MDWNTLMNGKDRADVQVIKPDLEARRLWDEKQEAEASALAGIGQATALMLSIDHRTDFARWNGAHDQFCALLDARYPTAGQVS